MPTRCHTCFDPDTIGTCPRHLPSCADDHTWYIEDDSGRAGLHYLNTGEAIPFDTKADAQRYIDNYLGADEYHATDIQPEKWEVSE